MESFETINQLWLSSTFELIDWNLTSSPDALGEFTTFPAMQQQNTDAGFWIGLKNIVEVSTQGQVNQPHPDSNYGADPPQKSSSTLKKRTSVRGSPDYIKKPLNAFMLYAKENRPILKMLYEKKDSASINKLLGQMWKTLSQGDKQKYFEEAQRLNDEHAIMYPNWSTRDNYGKTKKKKCCHAAHLVQPEKVGVAGVTEIFRVRHVDQHTLVLPQVQGRRQVAVSGPGVRGPPLVALRAEAHPVGLQQGAVVTRRRAEEHGVDEGGRGRAVLEDELHP
ncbi:transcription factor 7-like [Stigmatopora argus]